MGREFTKAQKEATRRYKKKNIKHIGFDLSKVYEQEYINIYETISNKAEWFRRCLKEYAEKRQK